MPERRSRVARFLIGGRPALFSFLGVLLVGLVIINPAIPIFATMLGLLALATSLPVLLYLNGSKNEAKIAGAEKQRREDPAVRYAGEIAIGEVEEDVLQSVLRLRFPVLQVLVTAGGLFGALMALAYIYGFSTTPGSQGSVWLPASCLVTAVWIVVRAPFIGVTLSDRGLRARNIFSSKFVNWVEVTSVEFDQSQSLYANLADGSVLKLKWVNPRRLMTVRAFRDARTLKPQESDRDPR